MAVALFVALALPASAGAYRGDGVFTLAQGKLWGKGWYSGDVAMLTDGSVITAVPSGAWRLTPDGRQTKIPGFGGSGVAATADGGVLALQGTNDSPGCEEFDECTVTVGIHRIVRWSPVTGMSVVAGTGARGFAGDGGPAVRALLNLGPAPLNEEAPLPAGIVAEPGGGFVFTDMANRRVRAVDAAGNIRTLAGGFRYPIGLAARPDGGYYVLEAGLDDPVREEFLSPRVREVRPNGKVRTIARVWSDVQDLAVTPTGAPVIVTVDSGLFALNPTTGAVRPYLHPADPAKTFDFAARSITGWNVGLDPVGGLLVAGKYVLKYIPRGPTPWSLAALRSTRTSRHSVTAVIETTQPGTATIEVSRRKHLVGRVTKLVPAGHSTLRVAGSIRKLWYRVRLQFEHAGTPTVTDEVPIHGAPTLTVPLARRLLGRYQGQAIDDNIKYRLGSECRRFGRRRVDCAIAATGRERSDHWGVASVTLERTGIVLRRDYAWSPHGFQRHPHYIEDFRGTVQRLSAGHGGRWAWGP